MTDRPLHIVHVITRLIVGGAQENTLLSCEGQHADGHRVTLVTGPSRGPEGSLTGRARAGGYEVIVEPDLVRPIHPRDVRAYLRLRRLVRRRRPDVVHTHSSKAGIVGRFAAWHAGVPRVVHTVHGLAFTSGGRMSNAAYVLAERAAAGRCHVIVGVADAMRDLSLARGIGRREQYVTVYSGMDVEPFLSPPVPRSQVRARLGLSPDHVTAVTVARLFDLKGHDDLLEAAPDLCRRFPALRFVWVGDGSLRPRFERDIARLGLRDRFVLTGLVSPDKVPELVNAADVLVHPSRREGLARALPQGSLAGLPVVTYDVDGNAEAVLQGESGWAVPAFDTRALVARLADLVADAGLRRRMGQAGRAFARSRFSTRAMVEALDAVYAGRAAAETSARG